MDLDIEIRAIRRKSDGKLLSVGTQLGKYGSETITGFELSEENGRIVIIVLSMFQSSHRVHKTPLEQL